MTYNLRCHTVQSPQDDKVTKPNLFLSECLSLILLVIFMGTLRLKRVSGFRTRATNIFYTLQIHNFRSPIDLIHHHGHFMDTLMVYIQ